MTESFVYFLSSAFFFLVKMVMYLYFEYDYIIGLSTSKI